MDCFESKNLPRSGKPTCHLEKGMLETFFNMFFELDLRIDEIMCYSMGDEKCVYQIRP